MNLDQHTGPATWHPRSIEQYHVVRMAGEQDPDRPVNWIGPAPRLNQGNEGHCGGFGAANEAGASPFRVKVDDEFGHAFYYEIKDRGLDPWGREDGTSSLAVAQLGVIRGLWESYWWVKNADDVLRGLHLGPMCFGLSWLEGMFVPDRDGIIKAEGAERGGHFVCATGYNPNYRRRGPHVRIRQSWGREHGLGGNVHIRLDELGWLLTDWHGEGFVPVGRQVPLSARARVAGS